MNIKWFGNMLVCLSMAGVFSSSQLLGEERGQRRALLIGCTRYDFLRDSQQLYGPANDVELVYDMLTQRFGFPEDNITVLAEERGEKHRPLKAHIQREFEQLIEVAEPGDQVWIHLSGHGTQLLDDGENTNDPDQKDGFDEAFCGHTSHYDGQRHFDPRTHSRRSIPRMVGGDTCQRCFSGDRV